MNLKAETPNPRSQLVARRRDDLNTRSTFSTSFRDFDLIRSAKASIDDLKPGIASSLRSSKRLWTLRRNDDSGHFVATTLGTSSQRRLKPEIASSLRSYPGKHWALRRNDTGYFVETTIQTRNRR